MLSIDSLFHNACLLYNYCTKPCGYNYFIIDEVESSKVQQLGKYISEQDRVNAVKLYREIESDIDVLRDRYCYNVLPFKSSFRQLAKDMYLFMKKNWLIHNPEFEYIAYILRFISTSDYYVIREFFIKRSYSLFYMERVPLDPDSFYCGYVPLEAFLDYVIKLLQIYSSS